MSMATIELSLYEALTEAGVTPDAARKVERQVESAIAKSQEGVCVEMHQQLMTKADGEKLKAELKAEMHKLINEQTWKLLTFIVAANGIMFALIKYLG